MSSLTSPVSSRTASPGPLPRTKTNRLALRQYYGLKGAADSDKAYPLSPSVQSEDFNDTALSELDSDSFDPETYVHNILDTKSLDEALRIENRLISEIKSLDGEKKALVYDNYSKLISATETIRKMRDDMVPLTPENSALNEDIARIENLAQIMAQKSASQLEHNRSSMTMVENEKATKTAQVETVRWVLDTPNRLKILLEQNKRTEADEDWKEIEALLDAWDGVDGVERVRTACHKVLQKT